MTEEARLELIAEAVRYCQRVRSFGMPPSCYSKALREPVHFLWEKRHGSKARSARYRSRSAVGLKHGKGLIVYDHAIPFKYLQEHLLRLDLVTTTGVAEALERYAVTVLITKAEDELLSASGYGHRMPEHWDGTDPLARYKAVGIELVDNTRVGSTCAPRST